MAAGVAAAVAGARGLGGPEEESVLWEGHQRPRDPGAPPRLREPRGEASGLQRKDKSLPGSGVAPGAAPAGTCPLTTSGWGRPPRKPGVPQSSSHAPPTPPPLSGPHYSIGVAAALPPGPTSQRTASSCHLCGQCLMPSQKTPSPHHGQVSLPRSSPHWPRQCLW